MGKKITPFLRFATGATAPLGGYGRCRLSTPPLRFAAGATARSGGYWVSPILGNHLRSRWSVAALVLSLAACGSNPPAHVVLEPPPVRTAQPDEQPRTATKPGQVRPQQDVTARAPARPAARPAPLMHGRALLEQLIPAAVTDRSAWANDIITAFGALDIPQTADHFCSVIAITEQESSFRADPSVPGLPQIARNEIEKQRERAGVPKLVVHSALQMSSPNGKSYSERLDGVQTERQLSDLFDDFIGMVPMGKTFFAERNPVRTGGPMQVSVTFAEKHASTRKYPYPIAGTIRNEVFARRGGMYFGIAHLLDYPVSYDNRIYRFADYNAGQYASRNAAFQNALAIVTGAALDLDGDLLRYDQGHAASEASATEIAARKLAPRLQLNATDMRRDLEHAKTLDFEKTRLYARVFALSDKVSAKPVPRAVLPRISLQSPKFTRKLTTEWFAKRVEDRHRRCLARIADAG